MAANTKPIFPVAPALDWATLTAANTAMDGTGTVATVFTAGANGARVDKIRACAKGTNVSSVLRVFANNGSDPATAANNSLVGELALPETTASNAAAIKFLELSLDIALPASYKLTCCLGTAVAAGWQVTAEGGDY